MRLRGPVARACDLFRPLALAAALPYWPRELREPVRRQVDAWLMLDQAATAMWVHVGLDGLPDG